MRISVYDGPEGNGTLENRLWYWLSMDKWAIDEAAKIISNIIPDQSSINANEGFSNITFFGGKQIPQLDEEGFPDTCGECVYEKGCECWELDKTELLKFTRTVDDIKRLLARSFGENGYVSPKDAVVFITSKKLQINWLDYALEKNLMPTNADLKIQPLQTPQPTNSRHPLQQRFQETEILRVIGELGFTATKLPPRETGKRWVKALVRDELGLTKSVFDKAWERLRADGEIKEE